MKIAFCSDWHLNFADKSRKNELANKIIASNCDLVLVAGDIAESNSLENELAYIIKRYEKPTYFVLGNHDYYRGSFVFTKQEAANIAARYQNLHYLPANQIVELNKDSCLIGYDSMYDCLNGRFIGGRYDFEIADFCHIGELKFLSRKDIHNYMVNMGALLADKKRIASNIG
jgi:Icc protein